MDLDDLIARVRAGRRSAVQAPGDARESIYRTALARATREARPSARRKPWLAALAIATPVVVAAAFLIAFLVPLPHFHVGGNKPVATAPTVYAPTSTTQVKVANKCQAQAAGVAYVSVEEQAGYPLDYSTIYGIDAIDLGDGKLLWSLLLPRANYVQSIAMTADGQLFAVIRNAVVGTATPEAGPVYLDRISTTTGHILKSIPLPVPPPVEQGLAVSPDGHWALVVESGMMPINLPSDYSDQVLPVDLRTGQVEPPVNLDGLPDGVRFASDSLAYVTQTNDEIVPIKVPSWALGPAISLPRTPGEDDETGPLALSPDGRTAVVMTQGADLSFPASKVFVVDLRSGVVHTIRLASGGGESITFSCDGTVAYAVSNSSVSRIDLRTSTSRVIGASTDGFAAVASQGTSPYTWVADSAHFSRTCEFSRYVADSAQQQRRFASVTGSVDQMVVAPPRS